jgi:hypothetical protein
LQAAGTLMGSWCLLGEPAGKSQPEGYPLMRFYRPASRPARHSRVLRISRLELNPRAQSTPYRLCYPSRNTSVNATGKAGLIVSPRMPRYLTVLCTYSLAIPLTTRSPVSCECRVLLTYAFHRVQTSDSVHPKQFCLFRALRTRLACPPCYQSKAKTLMALSRPSKHPDGELEPYAVGLTLHDLGCVT